MIALILSSLILTASPNAPTEVIGTAATPDGCRKEIIVEQPPNYANPFGNVSSPPTVSPNATPQKPAAEKNPLKTPPAVSEENYQKQPSLLVNQSSAVSPKDMNPLHYRNKIENTIYQSGNRLIDIQSIPLEDISSAVQPNLQPTITDYPSF